MSAEPIFSGLKVLDFTWAAAGPIATKQLADNGATVVKIESAHHPDSVRLGGPFKDDTPGIDRSGFFADFNSSKLSVALNMNHARALEIITPLVKWADVVTASFRPGIMERWGLSYERLKELNSAVVVVSSTLFGSDGPWSSYPGFGAQGQALAGFNHLTGWSDRPPVAPKGAYTDSIAARYTSAAIVAALIHRERTGAGQFVELSQIECGVQFLSAELLDYQLTGRAAMRHGNSDGRAIVHGVFPCRGEDRWIAIEVWQRSQWDACMTVLGTMNNATGLRGEIAPDKDHDANAATVAKIAAHWDAFELAAALQRAGVPAGVALRPSDLLSDSILRERNHFWPLDHEEMGRLYYNGPAYRFQKTPTKLTKAAPRLGEDTDNVLMEILGLDAETISELRSSGLLE